MKAVRLHGYHQQPVVDEVPEPAVAGPLDVIVKIGGAGLCRTDLHIIEGQWAEAMNPTLPYTIGHENAGWVEQVGSAVNNVQPGDTVILHPTPTCGLCRACRAGQDMHCTASSFPGLSADGGQVDAVLDLTGGAGAEVVLDFVAEQGAERDGFAMTGRAGSYFVIGYGGTVQIPTLDIISTERNVIGNLVGTYNDLAELMTLAAQGKVKLHTRTYPLAAVNDAMDDLDGGRLQGRGILVPSGA